MAFPTIQFIEFNKAVDPSGFRNIPASGIATLGTTFDGLLSFGGVNTSVSGVISDTKMIIARVEDLGDASGVFNLRFFLQSASAFNVGNYRFLQRISTDYLGPNFSLTLADTDVAIVEPSQNLLATNGQPVLSGLTDNDVSQYIYLAVFIDTDVPFGTYGGAGQGSFRYRLTYDFS